MNDEHDGWEQEVKREIARIKAKNKALKNARARREQQARALQKIQCLSIAKNYLANTFFNAMDALNAQHHWRSRFEDQLQVNYKDWLLKKVSDEFLKGSKVEEFVAGGQGSIVFDQLKAIQTVKEPIQKAIVLNIA